MNVHGYVRVSTRQQGEEGFGLEAQRDAIRRACTARGWTLVQIHEDVASSSKERAGLAHAVAAARAGAGVLMAARLDRLSRSVGTFAALMDRAQLEGWQLVCLDPAVDMTTPYGRAMAGVAAVFAQLERELIAQRTREGLEAARAAGVSLGRPSTFAPELEREILERALVRHEPVSKIARELERPRGTVAALVSRRRATFLVELGL